MKRVGHYCTVFLYVVLLIFQTPLMGQVKIKNDIHHVDSIMIVGRHPDEKKKTLMAPMPKQIITSTEIENMGIQNIADALRRFAGTNVKDYGGLGGMKTVSVRNMGAAHTGVAYDGVSVSNCQAGQIDIGRFSIDDIRQLSLSVGQNDDLLQSARLLSSGSVVLIQTMQPTFNLRRPYSLRTSLRVGQWEK